MLLVTGFCAFALGSTLVAIFASPAGSSVEVVVEDAGDAWVLTAAAGDRALGQNDVTALGAWTVQPGAPGTSWKRKAGPGPLSLRMPSTSWVWLNHASNASQLVVREGKEARRELSPRSSRSYFQWHPLLVAQSAWLGVVLAFAFLAFAFARYKPWSSDRRAGLWLVLVVGVSSICLWAQTPIGVVGDSVAYLGGFASLVEHGRPTYFPVGYAIFLEFCRWVSSENAGHVAALLHHAMVVHAAWMFFVRLRPYAGLGWAWGTAAVAALHPWTLLTSQALLSETFTFYTLALSLFLLTSRRNAVLAFVAGFVGGFGVLARVVPAAVLLPVFAAQCLLPKAQRDWRRLFVACAGLGLLPIAALITYAAGSGDARLSTGVGRHLYNHFVVAQGLVDEDGETTRQVLAALGERKLQSLPHWELDKALGPHYARLGGEKVFRDLALEAASTASIFAHAAFTLDLTWRNLKGDSSTWIPRTTESYVEDRRLSGAALISMPSRWRQFIEWTMPRLSKHWYLVMRCLALALLAALLRRASRGLMLTLLWVPLSYVLISSAVEYESARYKLAVLPFLTAVVLVAPAVLLARRARDEDQASSADIA